MHPQKAVDFQGLLFSHKRHHAKTGRQSELVGLVFGLLKCRCDERSNDSGFLTVDLPVACGAGNVMGKDVRSQPNAARISQRLNVTVVRKLIAELDDFANAAKVLDQPDRFTKGLAG